MQINDALRRTASAERSACPTQMRQAATDARKPIEDWRQSAVGRALEQRMRTALDGPAADRPVAMVAIARDHERWLPAYVGTLLRHLEQHPDWQPPLNDFHAEGQLGLRLMDSGAIRTSVLTTRPTHQGNGATPPIITLSSGHLVLCVIDDGPPLLLRQWEKDTATGALSRRADVAVSKGDTLHCTLSRQYWQLIPPRHPRALLRLEWPEDVATAEQHFDADSGAPLPHIMGAAGMRRHLALACLSALAPATAAPHLCLAISDTQDAELAWHYCRQLLASDASAAVPILTAMADGGPPALQPLAAQSLHALRHHYPMLFEAASCPIA